MKKIILGIVIGLCLSIGSISFASTQIKLVMVPEYVNGYKTVDLLTYVAQLKKDSDKRTTYVTTASVTMPTISQPVVKQPKNTAEIQQLKQKIDKINSDYNALSADEKEECWVQGRWTVKTDSTCYHLTYKNGEVQAGTYDWSNYDIYYNMSYWLPQYQEKLQKLTK